MDLKDFQVKYNYFATTQVMQQYLDVKFANFECLILFRMGDFYELFYEDAINAAKTLGIALTKRGKTGEEEIPMCGVPFHALENYLHKLLAEGYKVAICDQMETPEEAKKRGGYKAVVRREVIRIVTPGTLVEEGLLNEYKPNYLASIVVGKYEAAICYLDLSTSQIFALNCPIDQIINELDRIKPSEILLAEKFRSDALSLSIQSAMGIHISFQVDNFFADKKCEKIIENYYNIVSSRALGELKTTQISAIGSAIEYMSLTQKNNLPKLPLPKILGSQDFMSIDAGSRRNLELTSALYGGVKGSLFSVINHTKTKAGARLLYEYLSNPLASISKINARLEVTKFFVENIKLTHNIRNILVKTSDLERLLTRVQTHRASPRDLLSLKDTLLIAQQIRASFITNNGINLPKNIDNLVRPLINQSDIADLIEESIREDAPNSINDGDIIKFNFHPKIKELQELMNNARGFLEALKEKYRKETGIDSLKISNNNVIGWFIDITSRHSGKIADEKFIHRQTTANSVRYTTKELQELESRITNAKVMLINLEKEIFSDICMQITKDSATIILLANALKRVDVYTNFAFIADEFDYSLPIITEGLDFEIHGGRHPIVERFLKNHNETFTPNDCNLSFDKRLWLITGPNMAGKSTFLRQNAMIAILAHTGSFVPATYAKIGIIDKIFTRVGAGDDLTRGQSTFMVEMLETSVILSQSTSKSLVILDEVGRGTSTYDGLAIAWSVLEYIHNRIKTRCLFATHYHELTALSDILPALVNYTISIAENDGKILFLHKIIQGVADRSYGVHVAELAGLPANIIQRASQLVLKFEKESKSKGNQVLKSETPNLSLFDFKNQEAEKYKKLYDNFIKIDPDELSPKEALEFIYKLQNICQTQN